MFLDRYLPHLIVVILLSIIAALGYSKFNDYIDDKVQERYEEKIKEYQNTVLDKVKTIEEHSTLLVKARENDIAVTDARLSEILAAAQKKSFVTITKEGKCALTGEFLDTYNSIISGGGKK